MEWETRYNGLVDWLKKEVTPPVKAELVKFGEILQKQVVPRLGDHQNRLEAAEGRFAEQQPQVLRLEAKVGDLEMKVESLTRQLARFELIERNLNSLASQLPSICTRLVTCESSLVGSKSNAEKMTKNHPSGVDT